MYENKLKKNRNVIIISLHSFLKILNYFIFVGTQSDWISRKQYLTYKILSILINTIDFNMMKNTIDDYNMWKNTIDFNMRKNTIDFNMRKNTIDFNMRKNTIDFNMRKNTIDFNMR